jgi:cobalt-zinc-cadmium efflux system membrane fusion protein
LRLTAIFLFAVALASVAVTAAAGQTMPEPSLLKLAAGSNAAREIVLTPVMRKPVNGHINATATVEPDAGAVAHITSRIPARVVKLVAQPGQYVKAGDTLAILSSVEMGQDKADYLKARSLENIAEQNLKREQDLYAKKIAPMKDVLEARAARDSALAQFKSTRETLRLLIPAAELNRLDWSENGHLLSEFPLVSPIDGTLVKRNLTIGAMVDREQEPLVVINLDHVWVLAGVFEHDLSGLGVGDTAEVTVDAYPGKTFEGKVTYIGDEIDRSSRTVQARIEVPNPGHLLKPGMFARAEIGETDTRLVLAAPESAVYELAGRKVAFVQTAPGSFAVRPVTIGSAGGGTVEVLSGLHEGDRVVSRGGLVLKTLATKSSAAN